MHPGLGLRVTRGSDRKLTGQAVPNLQENSVFRADTCPIPPPGGVTSARVGTLTRGARFSRRNSTRLLSRNPACHCGLVARSPATDCTTSDRLCHCCPPHLCYLESCSHIWVHCEHLEFGFCHQCLPPLPTFPPFPPLLLFPSSPLSISVPGTESLLLSHTPSLLLPEKIAGQYIQQNPSMVSLASELIDADAYPASPTYTEPSTALPPHTGLRSPFYFLFGGGSLSLPTPSISLSKSSK